MPMCCGRHDTLPAELSVFLITLMCWFVALLIFALAALLCVSFYFTLRYQYWKRRNVPFLEPTAPFGNLSSCFLGKMSVGMNFASIYKTIEGEKFIGIYGLSSPVLLLKDPDLIHAVLVKDFESFPDRGVYLEESETLSRQLFCLTGCLWKRLRLKLAPAFSHDRVRAMFPAVDRCGRELRQALDATAAPADVLDLATRFCADVVACVAFGLEPSSLRNAESEFLQQARELFETSTTGTIMNVALFVSPALVKLIKYFSGRNTAVDYFLETAKRAVTSRHESGVARADFVQLLTQMRYAGGLDDDQGRSGPEDGGGAIRWKLPLDDAAAQALSFVLMGLQTTAAALAWALLELALNPDVQRRLQRELDAAPHARSLDDVARLDYLGQVVAESLRKYPPVAVLHRACRGGGPAREAALGAALEAGRPAVVSVWGLHRDAAHFPQPERFDPERFDRRHLPAAYLPFGAGPRACIGSAFALLQIKIGLIYILSTFNVETCEKTEERPQFKKNSFTLLPENGIYLRLSKRFE